jgi:hypothetical protein
VSAPNALARLRALVESLDDEPPAGTPLYDPVHVGGVLVSVLAAVGALYWLLWTALVFEGGVFRKLGAFARLATGTPAAQLGYEGPWNRGAFEGWLGNVAATLLILFLAWSLRVEWRRAARASRGKS